MDIVELYVIMDDFCKKFTPRYIKLRKNKGLISKNRQGMLSMSEIVLIYKLRIDMTVQIMHSIIFVHQTL